MIHLFRSRGNLVLENLVLRQQLAVLKRRHRRSSLGQLDKLFWVVVRQFWSGWKQALMVVTPETVVRWHRPDSACIEVDFQSQDTCREEDRHRKKSGN